MADYTNWMIGGLVPLWVINNPKIDREKRTITLNCFAARELMPDGWNPEDEIKRFNDIAARGMSNNVMYDGGTNLNVTPNDPIITVTNGAEVWERCALHKLVTQYGEYYNYSGLFFTLSLDYEERTGGGFAVYQPPYGNKNKYPNLNYYAYTDKSNDNPNSPGSQNEIGYLYINEQIPVKQIQIYGSGCALPAWIEVNGQRKNWVCSHEGIKGQQQCQQRLTFDFTENPITNIIIYTGVHLDHIGADQRTWNHGCWAVWIKVVYAE